MSRLTKWLNKDIATIIKSELNDPCEFCTDAVIKLAHYEDLEEQGRLIELPCKVDDELYYIAINKNGDREVLSLIPSNIETVLEYKDAIGKWLYLTREEAEAKLAELKGTEE